MKSKPLPPLSELQQQLHYNGHTGEFTWIKAKKGRRAGSVAGSINSSGYRVIVVCGQWCKAHRLAWLMHYGDDPGHLDVDHINLDKADNRISNLRLATRSQNAANNRKWRGGAHQLPSGRWQASARTPDGGRYLGSHDTREKAVAVASAFRQNTYGAFAS